MVTANVHIGHIGQTGSGNHLASSRSEGGLRG